MARQLRLDAPGLTHHVTSRGTNRKRIFRDDVDCSKFLELLEEAIRRYDLVLMSYSLMVNHFHLVLETPQATLSRGMQWLNGAYGRWFNDRKFGPGRRKRSGHVFQGRFHSFLIDSETYLNHVIRYVELNPVRSKTMGVKRPEDYRWSSYRANAGYEIAPPWLATSRVLARFGDNATDARQVYREFVCEKIGDRTSIWKDAVNGFFLGSEAWIARMRTLVESKPRSAEHPRTQTAVGRPSVDTIVTAVAEVFDIETDDVRNGRGGAPRMILAWMARYEGIARLGGIAATLRLRSSGYISDLIAYCERQLCGDAWLRDLVDQCVARLRPSSAMTEKGSVAYWPMLPLGAPVAPAPL